MTEEDRVWLLELANALDAACPVWGGPYDKCIVVSPELVEEVVARLRLIGAK